MERDGSTTPDRTIAIDRIVAIELATVLGRKWSTLWRTETTPLGPRPDDPKEQSYYLKRAALLREFLANAGVDLVVRDG